MNKFNLQAKFIPTGDQPQAIAGLLASLKENSKNIVLLGVTGSGKTFTIANIVNQLNIPTLVISHNKTLAAQLTQEYKEFFPNNAIEYFVSYYDYYQPEAYISRTDTYIEKEAEINDEIDRLRLSSTTSLSTRSDVLVCASVSCIYNIGSPEAWQNKFFEIKAGDNLTQKEIIERLVELYYTRSDFDLRRGTFRTRGDKLQIYPSHLNKIISVQMGHPSLFKIIESDPLLADNGKIVNKLVLYPAKHHTVQDTGFQKAVEQIKQDLERRVAELNNQGKKLEAYRLAQRTNYDLEMLAEIGYCSGIENYSRYFEGREPGSPPYTLLDYFNRFDKWLLVIDESHITLPQIRGMYRGDLSRKQSLIEHGFRLPSALDNRPLRFEEFERRMPQTIYTTATPGDWELEKSKGSVIEQLIRPTGLIDPQITVKSTNNQIPDLLKEVKERVKKGERVLITTLTKRLAEALTEKLKEQEIKAAYLHSDIETLERSDILDDLRSGKYDVLVGINLLREGLDLPEVSLVAILDADKEGFLRSRRSLIQVMGRAARHINGKVIMYADKVTDSMKDAISEVDRRRAIQLSYNKEHKITPTGIVKSRRGRLVEKQLEDNNSQQLVISNLKKMSPSELDQLAKKYQTLMESASASWSFEEAAKYRDEVRKIKKVLNNY